MPKSAQAGDFFVVGGPVQSDRACYVKRAADERLAQALADERFAYVLSPRATGKSSLMARTIRRLRSEGQLAAVVDLTQIGSRSEGTDAGRWYYSIAYRIVRELRLKVDLQDWWQERSALLGEQRLVEFFGDIVLANTAAPVNVFIDEADRAIDLPFATGLFVALRSCYMRRVSEPDFTRLNFVVLGAATPEQLCPDPSLSPFTDGVAIDLTDFTFDESLGLAAGFGDPEAARGTLAAIQEWTGGHPYLTQKLARALARRGGGADDVEQTVNELLLTPARLQEEPLLNQMRAELERGDKASRLALTVLGRVAAGAAPVREGNNPGRALLERVGVLGRGPDGTLGYRNRVFRTAFGSGFFKGSAPFDWQRPAVIAAAVLLLVAIPYWYFAVLPRPYIQTLTVVSQDIGLAEQAYSGLSRLPGFSGRADRLLADAMVRRSQQADSFADVIAADRVLRRLPEQVPLADRLLAGYWLRNAEDAMHRDDRDAALIYAIAAEAGQPERARAVAAELIDTDYPFLEATFRLTGAPADWTIDWGRDQLVLIDDGRRVRHLPLGTGFPLVRQPVNRLPGRLTAVQHVEVERELTVDADGRAGAFALLLTAQHGRASDLLVRLTAPSGASVEFPVPQPRADQQSLIFNARPGTPLAGLADEPIRGQWLLTLIDRRSGEQGVLTTWGLELGGRVWEDTPEQGIPLPDPVRTEQVDTILAPGGQVVITVPSRSGASGAISVWDLAAGSLRADIGIESPPRFVAPVDGARKVLVVDDRTARLWDVDSARMLLEVDATDTFATAPALSPDERFVALAEPAGSGTTRVTLIDGETAKVVDRSVVRAAIADWGLAAGGRYVAVLDGSRWLRFFDATDGSELGQVMHQRRLGHLAPLTRADLAVAVDDGGAVFAWPVDVDATRVAVGDGRYLGLTPDPASVVVADRARRVVFSGLSDRLEVRDVGTGRLRGARLRLDDPRRVRLSATGDELVAEGNRQLRRWHLGDGALAEMSGLDVSAMALGPHAVTAALGYRAGHLRVLPLDQSAAAAALDARVDYIGHRGAVTGIDVLPAAGIAASGGADGVVRIWDLASVAPNEYFLRHPEGPVRVVRISPDGRFIASGAEYSARLWQVQTGELVAEVPVDGSAVALAFAPEGNLVAVGDTAGNLFLGPPRGSETLRSVRMSGAITAVAFSPDSTLLASADSVGDLTLWNVAATEVAVATTTFPEAVRWIGFEADGAGLVVATDDWLHRLVRGPQGLDVVASRLRSSAFAGVGDAVLVGTGVVRLVAAGGPGDFVNADIALDGDAETSAAASPVPPRDWPRVLGLRLDPATGAVQTTVN